jgi:DNA helicase-2/ATP-dependent DNA helicase PcrA
MSANDIDILAVDRGTITAPAGCGKTHLIAEALARYGGTKPILVLTHTNAGVAALRSRLEYAGVPSKAYRVTTIDGWAIRLISSFPMRSGHDPNILEIANPSTDYPHIRDAAAELLRSGHLSDVIMASYSRIIVDEYQDCSIRQHTIISYASQILPTCVLGDPMQAIFGFGIDKLARWNEDVCAWFPIVEKLQTPWRWINANAEPLGCWLLDVREKLLGGMPVDLGEAPSSVNWIELDGTENHQRQLVAARIHSPNGNGGVLIIGDSRSPESQHRLASQTPGAIAVEAVDLKDLVSFMRGFKFSAPNAFEDLLLFAQNVMTNVGGSELMRRVQSLLRGTARTPPNDVEKAAITFNQTPSNHAAVDLLLKIKGVAGVRVYRPVVLTSCLRAFQTCEETEELSLYEAAVRIREQYRMFGRSLPRRAVGSTLLLKGLEAEVAILLNADSLDARNLYVGMTRGSQVLSICSSTPVLRPKG